jgi:pimeloyl-ACP methyl ester carboxylesterase
VQVENGEYILACPPEIEARVYMAARSNGGVYDSARQLQIPVTIVRGRRPPPGTLGDFSTSPTWPELANEFPNGMDIHWNDCTHFIPMQRPDDVIELIHQQVAAWVDARAAGDAR